MLVRVWMENEDNRGPDLPYCEREIEESGQEAKWSVETRQLIEGDEGRHHGAAAPTCLQGLPLFCSGPLGFNHVSVVTAESPIRSAQRYTVPQPTALGIQISQRGAQQW